MKLAILMLLSLAVGYLYAYHRDNRFRVVPGYSWAIDGRTGQLCDPWPAPYATAVSDREGIPYCAKLR
jgi:hypothetical protein